MSIQEIQAIANIIGDLTITAMLAIALIYVERRRITLSNEIFDDWRDMKNVRIRRMDNESRSSDGPPIIDKNLQ